MSDAKPPSHSTTPRLHAVLFPLVWSLTRLGTLLLLATGEHDASADVYYYYGQLHDLLHGAVSITHTLREYPVPALGLLLPQYLGSGDKDTRYLQLFAISMLAIDMIFTLALWRAGKERLTPGLWMWLVFVPALGPLLLSRFDLVPAVLVAAALLVLARRPVWTGLVIAAGAAVKLWPALALPALLLPRPGRRRLGAGFAAGALVAVVVTLAVAGLGRTVSPITWQSDRGLEIESIAATPLMVLRAFTGSSHWSLTFSAYGAEQISGPGVRAAQLTATGLSVAALVLFGWLLWRARRRSGPPLETLGWLVLAAVLLFIDTDKTLSTQYVIWVAAPLAVLAVVRPSRATRIAAVAVCVIAALSQVDFPICWSAIISPRRTAAGGVGVTAIALRNAGLLWLTWFSVREAYREGGAVTTSEAARSAASTT
jgi:hypothetical protein